MLTPSGINPCQPGDDESVSEVWDLERAAYEFSRLGGGTSALTGGLRRDIFRLSLRCPMGRWARTFTA